MPASRRPTRRFLSEGLRAPASRVSANRQCRARPHPSVGRAGSDGRLLPAFRIGLRPPEPGARVSPGRRRRSCPAPRRLRKHPSRTGPLLYIPIYIDCQEVGGYAVNGGTLIQVHPSAQRLTPTTPTRLGLPAESALPARGREGTRMTDVPQARSVDPREVARFDRMARDWWDPQGPMRALHRLNPVRLAYIRDTACTRFGRDPTSSRPLDGLTILDVGCGGGVLSEPLARLGGAVTGLDPAAANITSRGGTRIAPASPSITATRPSKPSRRARTPSTSCSPWRWWSTWPTFRLSSPPAARP